MIAALILLSSAVTAGSGPAACADRMNAAHLEEGAYGADATLIQILDESCLDDSTPALRLVIQRMGGVPSFDAGPALRALVNDDNPLFRKACKGVNTAALRKRGVPVGRLEVATGDHPLKIYRSCRLARLKVVTKKEMERARNPFAVVAHFLYLHLVDRGVKRPVARTAVRIYASLLLIQQMDDVARHSGGMGRSTGQGGGGKGGGLFGGGKDKADP